MSRYKTQPGWLLLKDDRERALRKRALLNTARLAVGTRELKPLHVGDTVQVQNQVGNHPSRWDITGVIVEDRPFDQYIVKVHGSGRLTTRNRKFLRDITPYGSAPSLPSNPGSVCEPHPGRVQHPPVHLDQPQDPQVDSERLKTSDTESTHLEISSENQDQGTPAKPPQLDNKSPPQAEFRRSTRVSKPTDRLNIESFKGQSYDSEKLTACQSVTNNHLHPVRPDGGEGITGARQGHSTLGSLECPGNIQPWRPWAASTQVLSTAHSRQLGYLHS